MEKNYSNKMMQPGSNKGKIPIKNYYYPDLNVTVIAENKEAADKMALALKNKNANASKGATTKGTK